MIGGASDGSIQIWISRKVYSRPDVIIRPAHGEGVAVTCVMMSPTDPHVLASRGFNGTIMLWDLRKPKTPYRQFSDLPNVYLTANLDFRYILIYVTRSSCNIAHTHLPRAIIDQSGWLSDCMRH